MFTFSNYTENEAFRAIMISNKKSKSELRKIAFEYLDDADKSRNDKKKCKECKWVQSSYFI